MRSGPNSSPGSNFFSCSAITTDIAQIIDESANARRVLAYASFIRYGGSMNTTSAATLCRSIRQKARGNSSCRTLNPFVIPRLCQDSLRIASAAACRTLDEIHFLGAAAQRLNADRAGAGEQIKPHAALERCWISRRQHIEQRFAQADRRSDGCPFRAANAADGFDIYPRSLAWLSPLGCRQPLYRCM